LCKRCESLKIKPSHDKEISCRNNYQPTRK
jgi:hypothetical protein